MWGALIVTSYANCDVMMTMVELKSKSKSKKTLFKVSTVEKQ